MRSDETSKSLRNVLELFDNRSDLNSLLRMYLEFSKKVALGRLAIACRDISVSHHVDVVAEFGQGKRNGTEVGGKKSWGTSKPAVVMKITRKILPGKLRVSLLQIRVI